MTDGDAAAVLAQSRDVFLECLRDVDEVGAVSVVTDLLARAVSPVDILVDVVAAAQFRVGELWQANVWSVAQEHAATHVSDRAVTAVSMAAGDAPPAGATCRGRVVVACLDGEFHALPARIVAEALRLAGWQVTFLGASVPTPHLTSYLQELGPDAVALSCANALRLPTAHTMVQICRRMGIPTAVGGRGFGLDGRWASALGARHWAPDARGAASCLESAVRTPVSAGSAAAGSADPRGHLADEEYQGLTRRRAELVEAAMDALRRVFPPMATYTEQQLRHTEEDLGYIVDFLAVALYVDDDGLFVTFVDWLADILAARAVPLSSVDQTLRLYHGLLYDFPRATRILDAGRAGVVSRLGAGGPRARG